VELFLQQTFNGLALGATYTMFALGFGMMLGNLGILNVAHGTFATCGAIAAYIGGADLNLPFVLAAPLGIAVAAVIGLCVDVVAFQPLRRRKSGPLGMIITSIGAWIILGELARVATDSTARRFPDGTFPDSTWTIGALRFEAIQVFNIGLALVAGLVVYLFVQRSRFGASIRAVGFDPDSAAIAGINPRLVIIATVMITSALAGMAGIFSGLATNNVSFLMGEGLLLKGFAAVVIGGFGDFRGAMIGGFLIGLLEVLSSQYISSGFRDAITFGLLVLFLIARPQGIFGEVEYQRA